MAKKLAVLIIHGMGSQTEGYEAGLVAELSRMVEGNPDEIAWQAVYWQGITEPNELAYLDEARRQAELDWYAVRKFVATSLGDAAAYQFGGVGSTYEKIHLVIRDSMRELHRQVGSKAVPLVVLAHSLGGHIMSNYIWDMQWERGRAVNAVWAQSLSRFEKMKTHAGFITFGSNIPLFTFAYENPVPIDFPGEDLIDSDRQKARWLNYYDPDDVLGWPLRPLNAAFARVVEADFAIDAGSWGAGLTPMSHVSYWTDNSFTRPVAAFLDTFL